ncbi:hypothetical protein [Pseudoalteromonas sp. SR41-4]|nr:hypothetical protein [Pseudoalteromonas sp. SR41-4]MBB1293312.1 hypothetical protein [Pseudoalteromonas sp. SR41-4]
MRPYSHFSNILAEVRNKFANTQRDILNASRILIISSDEMAGLFASFIA